MGSLSRPGRSRRAASQVHSQLTPCPSYSACISRTATAHAQQQQQQQEVHHEGDRADPAPVSSLTEVIDSTSVTYELTAGQGWHQIDTGSTKSTRRWIDRLQGTFLPSGYPDQITPDYLPYQLWTLPTHITGWIGSSLVTSSLLQAAGLGTGAVGTVAAGATIKWITKDGIGALGRYIVGGSLARFFDEDPRFWRFLADAVVAGGFALEIGTAASPGLFLLLAGSGNFAKAAGKGIGRPSFRVIQNHFALGSNVGDVSAKEEVWEVTAQLVGLALSVALLQLLERQDGSSAALIVGAWSIAQGAHLVFRYKALQVLQLPWISQRRGVLLAEAFLAGERLPTVQELCRREPFALPKALMPCSILTNASIAQLQAAAQRFELAEHLAARQRRGNGSAASGAHDDLSAAVALYRDDQYVLLPARPDAELQRGLGGSIAALADFKPRFVLALKERASNRDKLRALLQAAAHHRHLLVAEDAGGVPPSDGSTSACEADALLAAHKLAREQVARFEDTLRCQGWRVDDVIAWSGQNNVLKD